MQKEEAISLLEDWLSAKVNLGEKAIKLPIIDEVVSTKILSNGYSQYTFKYLIKVAYDLEDIKN